ncbi:LptF/LptG family permease [Myroides sp. LJL110]
MKILDRYILTSFASTLLTVFAILYFIFILQGVWLFITELAGKDLDVLVVIQFLLFYSPKMVQLVLPLSVLLASIMTFGSLAENYEFAAMKASGISLNRAMRPLSIFIFCLAGISFWFANDVIPKAEYKFINLRREIMQTKPAMAIAAGQFNEIGSANIKVDQKTGDKGQYLDNVTMHIRNNGGFENKALIRSISGELESNEGSNILKLHLIDGNYYEDIEAKSYNEKKKHPFIKAKFDRYTLNMDLSALNPSQDDQDAISNTHHMLNVSQLNYTIDSLQTTLQNNKESNVDNLTLRIKNLYPFQPSIQTQDKDTYYKVAPKDILQDFSLNQQQRILQTSQEYTSNLIFNADTNDATILAQKKHINSHYLALYQKFVIAFSCFLMFYIGAPLGAIIRKGGLGLPMVFAVIIFISYHFINTFGTKVAQEDGIDPILGAWMGPLSLTPLAIYLTYQATRDNGDVNFMAPIDWLIDLFKSLPSRFTKKDKQTDKVINQ